MAEIPYNRALLYIPSLPRVQWCHGDGLRLAVVGVFIPGANATVLASFLPESWLLPLTSTPLKPGQRLPAPGLPLQGVALIQSPQWGWCRGGADLRVFRQGQFLASGGCPCRLSREFSPGWYRGQPERVQRIWGQGGSRWQGLGCQ